MSDATQLPEPPTLRGLIREVATDMPCADPREIASRVEKLTTNEQVSAFYTEALVPVVRDLLREQRNTALAQAVAGAHRVSPKVAAVRDWWTEMLAARVHVGGSHWKLLGDCTADDLRFCISEREAEIERIQAQVARYERLLAAVIEHGAAKVSDLPTGAVQ